MFRSRLLGAVSLALLLAACGGQQEASDSTAGTAPGELPDTATAPAPATPDAAATPPAEQTASSETAAADEAATMGDAAAGATGDTPVSDDERSQTLPPNPARNPDPIADDPTKELQDTASPPPPVQQP